MKIRTATAKGARSYQEDRHFITHTPDGAYLGVFDGHGGDECAQHCVKRLPVILRSNPELARALEKLNSETRYMYTGSTASIVFIPKDETVVHVAVIGDSPVVVRQADGSIWVSPEHNVRTNVAEADAAKQRGGFVSGGYLYASYSGSGLQLSRSLGDSSLDKVLLRTPDVSSHVLGAGSFVLLASDGAVDPSHAHEAESIAAIVSMIEAGADAQQIVDRALAIPTDDNVTAILVTL